MTEKEIARIKEIAGKQFNLTVEEARVLITLIGKLFRTHLIAEGFDSRAITRLTTKFRDAGRRSPPWKPASGRVPGRPQDGSDGNRQSRWLFDVEHKFYADEITATLVEIRFYLQALSMTDAPPLPEGSIQDSFVWLLEHRVEPEAYFDPIQLVPISLSDVINDARLVQSGHLIPLDRGGRHEPMNTFLMLARSNQLQGNLTLAELIELLEHIVQAHREGQSFKRHDKPSELPKDVIDSANTGE